MNAQSVADKLAGDIRNQGSLHEPMVKDLAKLAASSAVTEEDFHSTFLKALGRYLFFHISSRYIYMSEQKKIRRSCMYRSSAWLKVAL